MSRDKKKDQWIKEYRLSLHYALAPLRGGASELSAILASRAEQERSVSRCRVQETPTKGQENQGPPNR
jgi:hypothetical protein